MSRKRKKDSRVVVSEDIKVRRFKLPIHKREPKQANAPTPDMALGKPNGSKKYKKPLVIALVITLVLLLLATSAGFLYSRNHKKSTKPTKAVSQYVAYINSPNYKNASEQEKVNFRLNAVTPYVSLSAYQKMIDELAQIQKEFPTAAQKNTGFLMYNFIAYHGLKDQAKTTEYARQVKALNPTLPVEYRVWQELVDKNAAQ